MTRVKKTSLMILYITILCDGMFFFFHHFKFILAHCHIPTHAIELEKIFRLILFNYIFSNGDAHVKNFSAIQTDEGDHVITPAYDLLCTRIHSPGETDMALTLFKDRLKRMMHTGFILMTTS